MPQSHGIKAVPEFLGCCAVQPSQAERHIEFNIIDKDLLKRLEDFRFENRIASRSEAIRRLLDEALKKHESKES